MKIDLRRYFSTEGLSDVVTYDLDLSRTEAGGVKPFPRPVKVNAAFRSLPGSVVLEARLTYELVMPCDRCWEETAVQKDDRFTHILVRELNGDEGDEEYLLVPEERLDLDELLTEDVLLELPSKFLCSPGCRGLCPTCGANLNRETCSCSRDAGDPRMEALRALLED